jgi:predicted ribosome quality control (RQC) complex YloA/Tae2 family protein
MDQAQGAIDAAKAAGAEQYASAEYTAAVDALKRSHEAVAQSDYRLALNHALDSRERAQNAARQAADTKAQVRSDVERMMSDIGPLMARANALLDAAEKARPRRPLAEPAKQLESLNNDVQKAGEAMKAGDYMAARPLLQEIRARVEKTIAGLSASVTTQPQRRRR